MKEIKGKFVSVVARGHHEGSRSGCGHGPGGPRLPGGCPGPGGLHWSPAGPSKVTSLHLLQAGHRGGGGGGARGGGDGGDPMDGGGGGQARGVSPLPPTS